MRRVSTLSDVFNQAEIDNSILVEQLADCQAKASEKRTQRSGSLDLIRAQNTIKAQAARIEKLERAVKALSVKLKRVDGAA